MRAEVACQLVEVQVVYEKSIGTEMNDLDLCLEVVSKVISTIALHSTLNISESVKS